MPGGAPKQKKSSRSLSLLIDCHCHLTAKEYHPINPLVSKWKSSGIGGVVAVGTDRESNQEVLRLAFEYPQFVYPALGLHPERKDITADEVEWTEKLITDNAAKLTALGEVGLPFYGAEGVAGRPHEGVDLLGRLLCLAAKLRLPVVLHAPHRAAAMALRLLQDVGIEKALFHWHKGDEATTMAIIEAGYFISVTPEVCYRERDRALARAVPLKNLLLESDGPWPYGGEFENRLTEPSFLLRVAQEVARLKGISVEALGLHLKANAERLFNAFSQSEKEEK